jgi:hypothetical protein
MSCYRPPVKQRDKHKRTNRLRSELIYSLRLSFIHVPAGTLHPNRVEPPHERAMRRHPARLSTRQERVKTSDERRRPEIHRCPPAGQELRRSPEGVTERREHT